MTMHERRPLWGDVTSKCRKFASLQLSWPDQSLYPCKRACSSRQLDRVHDHRSQGTSEEESHDERS